MKAVVDPTLLPKGKSQARSVTIFLSLVHYIFLSSKFRPVTETLHFQRFFWLLCLNMNFWSLVCMWNDKKGREEWRNWLVAQCYALRILFLSGLFMFCRKEAVTLPENQDTDLGDIEQSLNFSNGTATMGFQQTTYFAMVMNKKPSPVIICAS